ncbi:hypothetical protein Amet_2831 [Alkaliphilus metalliredigens QYMF]|uniref:Uncharacterized protein n=1 Tax=Alkaliphilus metalliredigens (strain QYMF) TaxID=293826 RepID=A6TS13_ALKMQ|nr:hypothetical protein [Alkaliphilus metalliredigens]ABR48981.1 hypothetical protein Amet_2831 [Alkaliphilus metalliredigens QYMF]
MSNFKALRDSFNRHIKEYGQTVLIDGEPIRAFFGEYDDKKNSHDHKYIFADIGLVKQGSVVVARGQRWISVSHVVNINNAYEKSLVREIKFCLKWQNKAIPCVMDARMQSIDYGQAINLATGNVDITIPQNEDTRAIVEDDNLFVANQKWKVEGIDYSKIGLITLYCGKTAWGGEEKVWSACGDIPDGDVEPLERSIRFTVVDDGVGIEDAKVTIKIEVGTEQVLEGYDPMGRPIWGTGIKYEEVEYSTDADGKVEILVTDLEELEEITIDRYNYIVEKDGYTMVEGNVLKEDIDDDEGIDIVVEL